MSWRLVWAALAHWTPPPAHRWRNFLLRLCGADIARSARIYGDVVVWWPPHLSMGEHASLGPGVTCYNVATIRLEPFAIVSQRAHLCSATHDCDDPAFPLRARAISIGAYAWVAAEAFVGPGVKVGEGAVLGARGLAVRDLTAWTIYGGNPATPLRARRRPA
nr:putative colanic acid biosynthesis acetyltransferase [Hansschlegelia quercus]